MALLNFRPPVDYESQQTALEGFLQNFKTVPAKKTSSAADALMGMNLDDDDDLSDDYDFMDDSDAEQTRPIQRGRKEAARLPRKKYMDLLQRIADRVDKEITVELDDLYTYESSLKQDGINLNLVSSIEKNAAHYLDLTAKAIDAVMPEPTVDLTFKDDVLDVIMSQRINRNHLAEMTAANAADPTVDVQTFPAELTRRYNLNFKPRTSKEDGGPIKALAVREIKGEHLGNLITVRGITTRVSDVKPSIQVNAYSCDTCGCEIFQPVNSKSFGPLSQCPSEECEVNQSKGQLFPSTRASKFLPFQEVKIQELAEQVPVGHIPRTLTILCHGSLTRRINPGDVIDCAGIFLPTPYTGFKAMRAGLLTDTYLEAQHISQHKKAYQHLEFDERLFRRLEQYRDSGHIYDLLANSIAPEIYGHLDVKKALLLLLVGGVSKTVGDGMKIRGDINICLMGDPGVAKSQLLKYITKVAPRGVYTTGRGSSGVGLTAAIMKDPVTGEMILEGGALVLADNGICCIDEFDKMDDTDRTAIHEVMEQQTISISKAGISTSLNARTSILAAANPLYGRYNPRISPVENINLPAALLSRFDVLFLILDTPSRDNDALLARHVTYVHMNTRHPDPATGAMVLTPAEVRQYVAHARTFRPTVSRAVADYITGAYVKMRDQQGRDEKAKRHFAHTSPRTLLGVLRLAQALARLRFADDVVQEDVDEALRLVDVSKASLYYDETNLRADASPSSKIYNIVKALAAARQCRAEDRDDDDDDDDDGFVREEMSMRLLRQRVLAKGFTDDQWATAVREYEELDVWQTIAGGTKLVFVTGGGEANDEDMDA